jgi:tetratricopeptide (TPR) repeat protein
MRRSWRIFYFTVVLETRHFFKDHGMRYVLPICTMISILLNGGTTTLAAPSDQDSIRNDGLKFCVSFYRDGYYNRTVECINDILPKLQDSDDSLQALKYLALSYGMINRIEQAEACFRQALNKNPNLTIDTLEFPPNIALIYKHVKLEKKIEQIDTTSKANKQHKTAAPQPTRSLALPTVMLTGAILSAASAGFLYFKGFEARQEYSTPDKDQSFYDKNWNTFIYAMGGGVTSTVLCGACTWLFFAFLDDGSRHTLITPQPNGISLSITF